ncbi:MAG: hypothetical protein JJLCMIEE_02570 [Acidimicrobiales bacterium]|nr:hypothetical protein [Acidimicrobiales bacterium]
MSYAGTCATLRAPLMAEEMKGGRADASVRLARGRAAYSRGDLSKAAGELNAAFEGFSSAGDSLGMGRTLLHLAVVALDRGDLDGGAASAGRGVEVLQGADDVEATLCGLEVVARVAGAASDPWSAVRLLAAAERHRSGAKPPDCSPVATSELADHSRAELGVEAFEHEWAAGSALSRAQAVALALARCGVAPA